MGVALGCTTSAIGLTAERFVPDRWSDEPGARLYRTGDLVRWRHDGLLEHLGRLDHQVKVRGFRIELGEIEAALSEHASVSHCVVVTRAEREDDVRLVAYCVPQTDLMEPVALREFLRERLPDYMLPQYIVRLDELPLLPNGKIVPQRAAEACQRCPDDAAEPRSARLETPEEIVIAEIWSELLGEDDISPMDQFLRLGRSLTAGNARGARHSRTPGLERCACPSRLPNAWADRAGRKPGQTLNEQALAASRSIAAQPDSPAAKGKREKHKARKRRHEPYPCGSA